MDKYLRNAVSDFIVGDAGYFQTGGSWNGDMAVPGNVAEMAASRPGVTAGGVTYGKTSVVKEFITEDYFRSIRGGRNDAETVERMLEAADHNEEGLVSNGVQLLGMEDYALGKVKVLEGDIEKVKEPGGNCVAAVYLEDDYGNPQMDSHWAGPGDKVTLRYVTAREYYDLETGELLDPDKIRDDQRYGIRDAEFEDKTYEVAAIVTLPHALGYRYYGSDEFIMNAETFVRDTGTDEIMYYACDVDDAQTGEMEAYLDNLTNNELPQFDFESKESYVEEFESFRSMFMMLGGVLSGIVGLVGILNFLNAILTPPPRVRASGRRPAADNLQEYLKAFDSRAPACG